MEEDLIDHHKKCRFCLGKIKSTRIAIKISENIEQSFFTLTNSKLKTSENFSSHICKTCQKNLESSIGFREKIIVNQQRLQKLELEDSAEVPVKEEAVEIEELKTIEIKTECFEFEVPVVQTWQESPKDETQELEADESLDDHSDEDSNSNLDHKDSLQGSEIETNAKKKAEAVMQHEESSKRVCPYCAATIASSAISNHIEAHENQINNTPLFCETCDHKCFTKNALKSHRKLRHPETLPKKKKKKGQPEFASRLEARQKIIEVLEANPTWPLIKISKFVGIHRGTVRKVIKLHKQNLPLERRKADRARPFQAVEKEKLIMKSFQQDPSLSLRKRGKLLGFSTRTVHRVALKIGFKVDESLRIYQCKLCSRKYAHNTTLNAHIKEKHMKPE